MSAIVNHVTVPVISNALCNKLYGKLAPKVKLQIKPDMLCAGLDIGGKDACQVRRHFDIPVPYKWKEVFMYRYINDISYRSVRER